MIHALYATGRNGEMGMKDGSLPWRTADNRIRADLPEHIQKQCADDMAQFKKLTTGNIIVMGYNTYKTFPYPLPSRINIVIDRTAETQTSISETGWNFFPSLEEVLTACGTFNKAQGQTPREVFIIGGAKLLKEAFSKKLISGKIHHTIIDADFPDAEVIFHSPENQ